MGGTPPPPPLRTKFSAKRGLRIWGVPIPPFTDKIRKVVIDLTPKFDTVAKAVYLNINVEPVERDQEFPRFHLECGHGDE